MVPLRFHFGWAAWIGATLAAMTVLVAPSTAHADAGEYTITVDLGDWTHHFGSFQALSAPAPTFVVGTDLEPVTLVPDLAKSVPMSCKGTE